MNDRGVTRLGCLLHLKVCLSSCRWWQTGGKCGYDIRTEKELADLKAMREASHTWRAV